MIVAVSNLNTVLSCCECSADAVVTVPTLSLRHRARCAGAPDGFSGSSWLALPLSRSNFHLVFIVFCASHVWPRRLGTGAQESRGFRLRGVDGASIFVVLVVSLARECDSVQKSLGGGGNSPSSSEQSACSWVFHTKSASCCCRGFQAQLLHPFFYQVEIAR